MLAGAFDCGWVPHARAGDRYGARSGTETAVGPDSLLSEVSGFADEATMQGGGFRSGHVPRVGVRRGRTEFGEVSVEIGAV